MLPKAGAEPDRVNDSSSCSALLAAAVNDCTDVGMLGERQLQILFADHCLSLFHGLQPIAVASNL